jgi:hypothetical protein
VTVGCEALTMEDLYGRTTLNKSLASPDGGKYGVRSAFGRLTPVPDTTPAATATVLGGGAGANGRPLLNGRPAFVPMTGRLTPNEIGGRASGRQKQQAGPQSSCASGGGGGLLNISSHNSSKLSSTTSGATSSQTKTTNDSLGAVGHHDLNSTQVGKSVTFVFVTGPTKFLSLEHYSTVYYTDMVGTGDLHFRDPRKPVMVPTTDTVRHRPYVNKYMG